MFPLASWTSEKLSARCTINFLTLTFVKPLPVSLEHFNNILKLIGFRYELTLMWIKLSKSKAVILSLNLVFYNECGFSATNKTFHVACMQRYKIYLGEIEIFLAYHRLYIKSSKQPQTSLLIKGAVSRPRMELSSFILHLQKSNRLIALKLIKLIVVN